MMFNKELLTNIQRKSQKKKENGKIEPQSDFYTNTMKQSWIATSTSST